MNHLLGSMICALLELFSPQGKSISQRCAKFYRKLGDPAAV
ncbi:hypothetical protein LINGRAHAP2_LOCUS17996 [Linum grandiflorum]